HFANALVNIGVALHGLDKDDSACVFFNRSLPIQLRLKNYYGLVNLYNSLGSVKLNANDFSQAMNCFELSRHWRSMLDSGYFGSKLYLTVETEYQIGRTFQEMKEFNKALYSFNFVRTNASKSSFLSFETDATKGISRCTRKCEELIAH
ncbi:MAG: tetratricopeptide repeat protein, partial [Bacteroidota bacterium]